MHIDPKGVQTQGLHAGKSLPWCITDGSVLVWAVCKPKGCAQTQSVAEVRKEQFGHHQCNSGRTTIKSGMPELCVESPKCEVQHVEGAWREPKKELRVIELFIFNRVSE